MCSFNPCDSRVLAKGLCRAHYLQQYNGKQLRPVRQNLSTADRFWSKVNKTGSCWLWVASKTPKGYGCFWVDGALRPAHRVSWSWVNGKIPAGMLVDHMCWNPSCVNPEHLRLATNAENIQNRKSANVNSKTQTRGVSWHKQCKKWQARVFRNGVDYPLGLYSTKDEAERVVTEWRRENMPYSLNDQRITV